MTDLGSPESAARAPDQSAGDLVKQLTEQSPGWSGAS